MKFQRSYYCVEICGDAFRLDLVLQNRHINTFYIIELTLGFDSTPKVNSGRKLSE